MSQNRGYDFYMDKCLLPISPEKLQIKINNANQTVYLINEGEINILKKAELTDIEFECEIPQIKYPFAVYISGFKDAGYFLDFFEELKNSRKPFQFIVSRQLPGGQGLFSTNMKVSLEEYTVTEEAKNGFDLTVKIKLKQWKDYGTKTVSVTFSDSKTNAVTEVKRETTNSPEPESAQSYTVVNGDCLWTIAKKFYGDGSKYGVIYETNKSVIGSSPNLIYPGQILIIPDASTAVSSAVGNTTSVSKTVGSYKGTGGRNNNPPFVILTSTYSIIRINILTWSEAWGYYSANGGQGKGWVIVDADNCIISV